MAKSRPVAERAIRKRWPPKHFSGSPELQIEVRAWLLERLKEESGRVRVIDVLKLAEERGWNWHVMQRAKKGLNLLGTGRLSEKYWCIRP